MYATHVLFKNPPPPTPEPMQRTQQSAQQQSPSSSAIHVLFLEVAPTDPWLNRLTAAVGRRVHGRGFCHVEVCVPHPPSFGGHQPEGYVSSSIYNGETVTSSSRKTFANPGYAVHTEVVGADRLRAIHDGISEATRQEVGFDGLGMYLAALPFAVPGLASNSKTFCSRYVTELLQAAGVGGDAVQALDPRITTPSKLYKVLKDAQASSGACGVVGTVHHKQEEFRKNASAGATRTYAQLPERPLFQIE